ncbi:phosphate ABC transporter, permease protein PstA [Psittacicella gerlachiana]|uniref:Phosphate transport system permease protein PstA n=2 Tax=Psittacicella gerlachiana TaxID=2028574 RepID=A0A3A1YFJ9_9GAMM|nr:phosphate ABC transporter permease PstA [Psittacicella gerlachiana]RIY35004.1 phosphate ABC transporter, permease protein PstA [Psittacicella gerlachiana]
MAKPNTRKRMRQFKNKLATVFAYFCVIFCLFWLVWITALIIYKGINGLSLATFTQMTPAPNEPGGLLNAIVGSFIVCIIATLIGTPLGVLSGIYLAEYGKKSFIAECLRTINDVLLSAPSIVLGLFIFIVVVTPMGGFSAIAGALALSLLQIPVVIRTTENMLQMVPNHLRESSAALGLPKYKSILHVTLKASWSGILTGLLLSIARIAGETGPLLFTSLNNQFWNIDITEPTATLPMVIYKFALSPYQNWIDLAWAAVLIITVSILLLNLIARYAVNKSKA